MTNRTDNFNRTAFSALGTPSGGGSSWVDPANVWQISSLGTQAFCAGGGTQRVAFLDSATSNVEVQALISGTIFDAGLVFRGVDASNYVLAVVGNGSANPKVYTCIAGAFTQIGSNGSATFADGDTWKVVANGAAVEVFQNGVSRWSGTVSYGTSNTLHGLRENGGPAVRFDDFSITDISGGGGGGGGPQRMTGRQMTGGFFDLSGGTA